MENAPGLDRTEAGRRGTPQSQGVFDRDAYRACPVRARWTRSKRGARERALHLLVYRQGERRRQSGQRLQDRLHFDR